MNIPKVLIVEDNDLNMKLFHDLLSIMKCNVIATSDGTKAVEMIRSVKPDLVLMDIQLGGVSGIDLIKEMKADLVLQHIPVVAVTAYAMSNEEHKIRQSGCDEYLSKPVSIVDFFNVVRMYVTCPVDMVVQEEKECEYA